MTEAFRELRAAVGWQGRSREDVVERRHLRDYLRATGEEPRDPGDVEVAPPTFCACFLDEPPPCEPAERYGQGWLNGGDRFELVDELRVGDVVRSQPRLVEVEEKHGRSGPMALLTFVTEFVRADGRLAVRHVGTRIRR